MNFAVRKCNNITNAHLKFLLCLLLIAAILSVFWQVQYHSFINYDDNVYVTQNRSVQSGLSRESVLWAFTATDAGFWHPLTWLSLMFDYELYRLNSAGYHWTNVLFHIANTLLLFLVLNRMTGALWRSGFVAALFAVHPLHVESVAWVAERKDVLSTFFWMLTMYAYVFYVERQSVWRYVLVFISFLLGLMAKPMLVTLPFVFLLLDYWPLKRLQSPARLVLEKAPFIVLTIFISVTTFITEQKVGALSPAEIYPLDVRIQNVLISYVAYIKKMIWPSNFAILYPYPANLWPIEQVVVSGLVLAMISIIVIRWICMYPYLAVGWFWYLGTLVPVIGFIQVGIPAMADRYTYVPLIGLFISITWGFPELLSRWKYRKAFFTVTSAFILIALMICAWFQVRHWKNSVTILSHTIQVTERNYIAHNNLGLAFLDEKRIDDAIQHFQIALRIKPQIGIFYTNLGVALSRCGKVDEAISNFLKALEINSNDWGTHFNLGIVLIKKGNLAEGIVNLQKAVAGKPDNIQYRRALADAFMQKEELDNAIVHYDALLQVEPGNAELHNNLGVALAKRGRFDESVKHFNMALMLEPDYTEAYGNLQTTLKYINKSKGSVQ
ncbi:MAG: tetratricopeptide repeat protein [Syntrophaceae bacterium]